MSDAPPPTSPGSPLASLGASQLQRESVAALAVYAAALALCGAIGYRMDIPWGYFQLLDRPWLQDRLWESLLHLHAQPPLLNLFVGLALQAESFTGQRAESWLLAFHIALGAVAVLGFVQLAHLFFPRTVRRRLCIALYLFSPVFYMALFHGFYVFHEIVYLTLLPVCIARYLRTRRTLSLAATCLLLLALVYTRSLFHFIWAGLVPLALLLAPTPPGAAPSPRLRHAAILLLTLAALLAWPIKNQTLFGSFGYSSWLGYSLAKGLHLETTPDAQIGIEPVPERFANVPALAEWYKRDLSRGKASPLSWNWNHYNVIAEFKARQRSAMEALVDDPVLLARRVIDGYWNFTRPAGRHPFYAWLGTMEREVPLVGRVWLRIQEVVLLQDFRSATSLMHPSTRLRTSVFNVSGFYFTFPLIVLLAAGKSLRLLRRSPIEAATATFMLYAVLWVLLMVLTVDGDEANRIRTSTEPYLYVLALWILPESFWTWMRSLAPGAVPRD